jgi:hypothetical protein
VEGSPGAALAVSVLRSQPGFKVQHHISIRVFFNTAIHRRICRLGAVRTLCSAIGRAFHGRRGHRHRSSSSSSRFWPHLR